MRSSNKRSRGNKNRNNRPSGGNIINRVFDSSGPDGKVRGTPQQIIEKYSQLHRDAQLAGDRVAAENFAQHGEHYTRMLAEAQREVDKVREEQEEQNRQRQAERDRERAARLKAQEEAAGGDQDQPSQGQGAPDQSGQDGQDQQNQRRPRRGREQPRAEDMPSDDIPSDGGDSGLVETPEGRFEGADPQAEAPKRQRRPRKPRGGDGGDDGPARDNPATAAE